MKTSHSVRYIIAGLLILGVALLPGASLAADGAGIARPEVKTVALFKNGLGFFTTRTTLPDTATVVLGQLPVPAYGTFWASWPEGVKVTGIISSMEETEETVNATNLIQLLHLNAGRRATFQVILRESVKSVSGTIIGMSDEKKGVKAPNPYFMEERRPSRSGYVPPPAFSSATFVLVKTDEGTLALNMGLIQEVNFGGEGPITTSTNTRRRPSIRVELAEPAAGKDLWLTFLAKGITWQPSYQIDITDPEKARLSARALVINEVTDLDGVRLELITGYPNIKFGEILSPVAMSENLAGFLKALSSGRTENRLGGSRGRVMTQQALMPNVSMYDESAPTPAYSASTEGTVSEDLFLYPVKDVTLKKGETAYLPLFTEEMPYRHIYIWKIPDFLDKHDRYQPREDLPDGKMAEEVWHSARIKNTLDFPLTTAAAEFVKEGHFVGQDICYYTAPGTKTTIRINRAMNVLAEQAEFEVERQRNAATFYSSHYDLVKVTGELKLRSRLDRAVTVEITKELSGEINAHSPEAKIVKTAKGLKQVNPVHRLTWEIELGSGEAMKVEYSYEVYVRN